MKKTNIAIILLVLLITFVTLNAKPYKGGEFRSKDSFLYGRFEASFKAAGKEGSLSTMFTYFDGLPDDPWSTSKWNEIDIEVIGRYTSDVQYNTITPGQTNHVKHEYVSFNPALDYHTYAIEWTPDYVAWFLDGKEVYRQTESFVKTLVHRQKLMFNVWVPTYVNWMGQWNDQVLPTFTYYDWASYYKYTPGTGNYGSGNNFTLDWKDEFAEFDTTRWEKGVHTFGGNNADFIAENIVFKDGKMIICLTNSTDLGYTDKKAPAIVSVRALDEYKIQVFFSEEVTKATAEDASKYVLANGASVKKATLQVDNRTVILDVDKLDLKALPMLVAYSGIKDNFGNSSGTTAKAMVTAPIFKLPLKINVGGAAYKDYIADREFTTDTCNYGYMEGQISKTTAQIANTESDSVFQTEINGMAKYIVRIPNGKYRVKLLFSENYYSSEGRRIFDVFIQGNKVLSQFDIFKEAGGKTAVEKIFNNVEVTDYMLDVHFAALLERALLDGIVIEDMTTEVGKNEEIPSSFELCQNYPNPFNPETVIQYSIPGQTNFQHVTLKVYDTLGREVSTLVDEVKQPGVYKATFSGSNLMCASGVYFYTLRSGDLAQTRKMILAK